MFGILSCLEQILPNGNVVEVRIPFIKGESVAIITLSKTFVHAWLTISTFDLYDFILPFHKYNLRSGALYCIFDFAVEEIDQVV